MSVLDRKYMLRLDLSKQKNNTEMEFNISDNQTSDFSVKITHKGKPVDLTDSLGLLVVTKPSGKVEIAEGQIIETSSVYFNLQNNCKDEVGIYSAYVVLGHTYQDIIDDKDRVLLGQITYVVNNDTVQELQPLIPGDDNFQIMIDIITRLQELESNENARILAEQLRVQAEQARVAEHNSMIETFDTKVEEVESTIASVVATEQGIKEAEAIRVTSENTRINNETDRQHTESDRVVAEKKRVVEHDSMMDSTTVAIANINSTDGSIKEAESKRVLAEQQRVDAENIREQAIEKVKTDIVKLINDTNKKIDDYKLEKDTAIQQDLEEYKSTTTQDIQDYKKLKDTEINKNLSDYKTSTTTDINNYKSAKDRELDNYKTEKDLEIDTYVANKNKELDRYVADKNNDIDNYKNSKDTLINDKLREVDVEEQKRATAETLRQQQHTERETFLNSFESQLGHIESKLNSDIEIIFENKIGKFTAQNIKHWNGYSGKINEDGSFTFSYTNTQTSTNYPIFTYSTNFKPLPSHKYLVISDIFVNETSYFQTDNIVRDMNIGYTINGITGGDKLVATQIKRDMSIKKGIRKNIKTELIIDNSKIDGKVDFGIFFSVSSLPVGEKLEITLYNTCIIDMGEVDTNELISYEDANSLFEKYGYNSCNNIISDIYAKKSKISDMLTGFDVDLYNAFKLNTEQLLGQNIKIVCYGDSLTMGAGWEDSSPDGIRRGYPEFLREFSGIETINCGIGGDRCQEIFARIGSEPIVLNDITIPKDKSKVEIGIPLNGINGRTFQSDLKYNSEELYKMNPCMINGVPCKITQPVSRGSYYLELLNAQSQDLVIDRPSILTTYPMQQLRNPNDIYIFYVGQNGGYDNIDDWIQQIRNAIDFIGCDKYLVIACQTNFHNATWDINYDRFRKEFKSKFLDIRSYILEYGLEDSDLMATEKDLDDISKGICPQSLKKAGDSVHFNYYGYKIIGKLAYERLKSLYPKYVK